VSPGEYNLNKIFSSINWVFDQAVLPWILYTSRKTRSTNLRKINFVWTKSCINWRYYSIVHTFVKRELE
jgi:hypothetical protein